MHLLYLPRGTGGQIFVIGLLKRKMTDRTAEEAENHHQIHGSTVLQGNQLRAQVRENPQGKQNRAMPHIGIKGDG